MSNHTPGKWLQSHREIPYDEDGMYREANAKLIAAAPEMLEALQEAPIVSMFSNAEDFISAYEQWRDKYKTPALRAVQP